MAAVNYEINAIFKHGNPTMVDITAPAALSAGDAYNYDGVGCVMIAHQDIASGAVGAVAVGGGVYEVNYSGGDAAIGSLVYCDASDTDDTIDTAATGDVLLGICVDNASGRASTDTIWVYHVASPVVITA